MAKLLENIFRSVNIALVNELAMLADRMDIDIWEVVDAAATKPFGFMRFDPGPGMGGHCLPVDPFYLSWKAREVDFATEFIELAGKVNQNTPYFCVDRVVRALNDLAKPARGSRIAVLGVAYKPGVGDVRESPALKIIDRLQALGADIAYVDAYVPELAHAGLKARDLGSALDGADLALIVTAHPGIDYAAVAERVPTVDFRGVTRAIRAVDRPARDLAVPKRADFTAPMEVAA
jgi:UDP-N-acetyl-D-glucosamine dehydrogenase